MGESDETVGGQHGLVTELLNHCTKAKATQPGVNTAHHARWEKIMYLIENSSFEQAINFAEIWAGKNWKAWVEALKMLKKIVAETDKRTE